MDAALNTSEVFALSEGGPFNSALAKMHLQNKQGKLALIALCITWLPLVIITAIEGTLYGSTTTLPFIKDFAMQARVLIALPMLIMIKSDIDSKVSAVTKYLSDALMSPEERQLILTTAMQRAKKLTSSAFTEICLLIIVIAATVSFIKTGVFTGLKGESSSWMATTEEGKQLLSVAGYYAVIISIPFFQFFLLRWLWRYFVWVLLLFRLSHAKLNLSAIHPDRSGGLGIIMLAQRSFNLFFVAGSVVISGQLIAQLLAHPDAFNTIRSTAIAYIVICVCLLLLPMLFFTAKLFKAKNEGLLHLGNFGATLSRKFEGEWVNDLEHKKKLNQQEVNPSMIQDYSGLYNSLQQLRTVPVTTRDIIGMAVTLFVPFIPILFIHYSVAELLQRVLGLLV